MAKPVGQAFAEFSREFAKEYCLAWNAPSGCSGRIVRAHTVQRTSLAHLAENGHVMQMNVNPRVLTSTGGLPEPKRVGINRGSTFTGFCEHHDAEVFRPLEAVPFDASAEQLRLLTYRSACRELFQKRAAANAIPPMAELAKGRSFWARLVIRRVVSGMVKGTRAGLRSMEGHKERLDALLQGSRRGSPRGVILSLSDVPRVMCSGGIYPDEEFDGRPLQDLRKTGRKGQFLAFSMFARDKKGFAAFTWEADSDSACRPLVESLLSKPSCDMSHLLVLFAFEYLENTLFAPSWWKGLSAPLQRRLQLAVLSGVPYVPDSKGRRLRLEETPLATWEVRGVDRVATG